MSAGSDKKGQDKKRICKRYRENRKAKGQTLEYKTSLVWTHEKERRLCVIKDDGDGSAR